MRKTAVRLSKVKVSKGRRLWCVTWPKIGKGRNRQFFTDEAKAQTVFDQKKIEQENFGTAGLAFDDKKRGEYLKCAEKLEPFGKTISDAVNFYLPHLEASNRTCTAAELVLELLKV